MRSHCTQLSPRLSSCFRVEGRLQQEDIFLMSRIGYYQVKISEFIFIITDFFF